MPDNFQRTGVLLINLGTPDSPRPRDVGRYLREFLMDPYVIDIPYLVRWFLVNVLIVPRRKVASGKLYEKVWTTEGSPLLVHTLSLADKTQKELGDRYVVRPAMRYGKPSLEHALGELKAAGVSNVVALPLYPQYSLAATESSVQRLNELAAQILPGVPMRIAPAFYREPEYLDAVAEISRPQMGEFDKVLFSFHGLPERQVKKTHTEGGCLATQNCCEKMAQGNANCYRAQSFHTAREVAQRLGLKPDQWEVGFQSRLGGTPWIRPYSDVFYEQLPKQGVRKLTVLTPSFVADCLETLEEVQMRGDESFREAGGHQLKLVPSLNSHPVWVQAVGKMVRRFASQSRLPA
jgi:protoporphyrin/coproporphyrin ferrochelatase